MHVETHRFYRLFHPMAQYIGLATGVPFPSLLTMLYGPLLQSAHVATRDH